jgi:hypothetical protein
LTIECVIDCGRPTETRICRPCLADLLDDLREVETMLPDLDVAVTRQAKIGGSGIGFVSGSSEQRIPVHLGAAAVLAELRDKFALWVQNLWEDHAPRWHRCKACGAEDRSGSGAPSCVPGCPTAWETHLDPLVLAVHPLPLSRWLLRHPTWIAEHQAAAELHDDIRAAVRHAKRVIYGPAERVYLGICSYRMEVTVEGAADSVMLECETDLYGHKDRARVVCPGCGAEWDSAERRRWMLVKMEDQLLTATEMSRALPSYLDRQVTASMIRGFAHRNRLLSHGSVDVDPEVELDEAVVEVAGRRRSPRYRVGDVLDLLTATTVAEAS